jgi:hypothetical protein
MVEQRPTGDGGVTPSGTLPSPYARATATPATKASNTHVPYNGARLSGSSQPPLPSLYPATPATTSIASSSSSSSSSSRAPQSSSQHHGDHRKKKRACSNGDSNDDCIIL